MSGIPYIIIKHKNAKPALVVAEYDKDTVSKFASTINEQLAANNVPTEASKQTNTFFKLMSNKAPFNKIGGISKAIEDIVKSGRIENTIAQSLFLRYATTPLRGVCSIAGYPSFTDLYDRIKFGGTALTLAEREEFIKALEEASQEEYKNISINLNENKFEKIRAVNGLPITNIETVDDTYESEIPLKRVEKGFDIATYLYNKNESYSFTGFITDVTRADGTVSNVESVKQELIDIRNSKISFDVEFAEEIQNSTGKARQRPELIDCFFSSISFSRSNKAVNGYKVSFSLLPIKEGVVERAEKRFVGNKKDSNKKGSNKKDSNKKVKQTNEEKEANAQTFTKAVSEAQKVGMLVKTGFSFREAFGFVRSKNL